MSLATVAAKDRSPQFGYVVLDRDEKALIDDLAAFADHQTDWPEYRNHYIGRVRDFYFARGLSEKEISRTVVWKIAQHIGSRLQVELGDAEPPDYRDELEDLISVAFDSRREFCRATGLSEDMLSHLLAKRKHLSIQSLSEALAKIGYAVHIAPIANNELSN